LVFLPYTVCNIAIRKNYNTLAFSGFNGRLSFHHLSTFAKLHFAKACASLLESFAGPPEHG